MRDVNEQQLQQKKYLKCQAILQFFFFGGGGDKAIPEINKYILKTPWLLFIIEFSLTRFHLRNLFKD